MKMKSESCSPLPASKMENFVTVLACVRVHHWQNHTCKLSRPIFKIKFIKTSIGNYKSVCNIIVNV